MTYTIKVHKTHATISVYESGKMISQYKTIELPKSELEEMEYFTENDIKNWLRWNNGSYHAVKS